MTNVHVKIHNKNALPFDFPYKDELIWDLEENQICVDGKLVENAIESNLISSRDKSRYCLLTKEDIVKHINVIDLEYLRYNDKIKLTEQEYAELHVLKQVLK